MLFWLLINGVAFKPPHFLHGMIFVLSKPFPPVISSFGDECFRFLSAITFLSKFRRIKSLSIELPSSSHIGIDNRCLFKWKVKVGNQIESLIFLSPSSVRDKEGFCLNGNGDEEEDNELPRDRFKQKYDILFQFLKDVMPWHMMLLFFVKNLPMLEEVSITDSGRRGRLSLSGKKLIEVKEWVHSASEAMINDVDVPNFLSSRYIPVLNLPISGYVMKEMFCALMEMKDLQSENDDLMNSENGFEDKEEAAYTEAVMEILEKRKGMMRTVNINSRYGTYKKQLQYMLGYYFEL